MAAYVMEHRRTLRREMGNAQIGRAKSTHHTGIPRSSLKDSSVHQSYPHQDHILLPILAILRQGVTCVL
jgi:hypothetical protein